MSYEYILIENRKRSIRFERESPNPIWWFDYTVQKSGPEGRSIAHVETPDVEVVRSRWRRVNDGLSITLKMLTDAEVKDYAIALWGIPPEGSPVRSRVETDAKEFVVAKNTDGEYHVVLFFDLQPGVELQVTLRPVVSRGSRPSSRCSLACLHVPEGRRQNAAFAASVGHAGGGDIGCGGRTRAREMLHEKVADIGASPSRRCQGVAQ